MQHRLLISGILLIAGSFFAKAQTGIITTIAGDGVGDGRAATISLLSDPSGVAVDASGNVYIADYGNNRIRKVDTAGIITTFAGTGVPGFSGDGGTATAAQLNRPNEVAIDAAGNVYIADVFNNRIRKVNALGIISTVAGIDSAGYSGDGGPATAAGLTRPTGVALDATGNMYIVDNGNNAVRKVNTSGIMSTIAYSDTTGYSGDGGPATAARLNQPLAVAVDHTGNVFIADVMNNVIRKVNTSGIISTVAGNGYGAVVCSGGYSGDGGPATDAEMFRPYGVAVDDVGNIYIADNINNSIRKVDTLGIITTFAHNDTANFCGDGGPASAAGVNQPQGLTVDAIGNVYIADDFNSRIRKVNTVGMITTIAGNCKTCYISDGATATAVVAGIFCGIAADAAGNVYFSGTSYNTSVSICNNSSIFKETPTGIITAVAGTNNFGFGGDGGHATAALFNNPQGLYIDRIGNLYIADEENNRIRKIDTTGIISTIAGNGSNGYSGDGGPATAAEMDWPCAVAVDALGNVYFTDSWNDMVRKVDTAGIISVVAGTTSCLGCGGGFFSGDGGPATAAELSKPMGVAVDASGNIYIDDWGNRRIRKVDGSGIITTIAGNGTAGYSGDGGPATAAELSNPWSVTVDATGNVFIPDYTGNIIRKVDAAGIITTITGTGTAGFKGDGGAATASELYNPTTLAFDVSGNMYIADAGNMRIRKVAHAGGMLGTTTMATADRDISAYPNPAYDFVYVSGADNCQVTVLDVVGEIVKTEKIIAQKQTIDIRSFKKGVYTLLITGSETGMKVVKKIVKP